MNDAGSVIRLSARPPRGDAFNFSARVLYWWEVQAIRLESVVMDNISAHRFLDRSKLYGRMIDTFLDSVEDDGMTISRSDLRPGESWRYRLHPTIIQPIYDAYDTACSPTTEELNIFREQVRAYFDPTLRPEGIYIVPPEIWEVTVLSQMGGISLSEIRKLSYAEMKKLIIVIEIMDGGATGPAMPINSGPADPFSGLVPPEILANSNLSPQQAAAAVNGIMNKGGMSE